MKENEAEENKDQAEKERNNMEEQGTKVVQDEGQIIKIEKIDGESTSM